MGQKKNTIKPTFGCQGNVHKGFSQMLCCYSCFTLPHFVFVPFLRCFLLLQVFLRLFLSILAAATALQGYSYPMCCLLPRACLQSDGPTPSAAFFFPKHFSVVMPAHQITLWLLLCHKSNIYMLLFT